MNTTPSYCFFVTFIGYSGSVIQMIDTRAVPYIKTYTNRQKYPVKKITQVFENRDVGFYTSTHWADTNAENNRPETENIRWIIGWHTQDCPEAVALISAYALARD